MSGRELARYRLLIYNGWVRVFVGYSLIASKLRWLRGQPVFYSGGTAVVIHFEDKGSGVLTYRAYLFRLSLL